MDSNGFARLATPTFCNAVPEVETQENIDPQTVRKLSTPLRNAILKTRQWFLNQQQPEGYWVAELEGDTILESEYILLLAYLGREFEPVALKAANYLIEQQLPTGGWAMYPGGAVEISGSVKAYFALKLTGHSPSAEYMQRARAAILRHGGADAVNSFTRFYLALLGQISYEQCPAVPPELMYLPTWFPVNLYAMSSWSRTMVVPLSVISSAQPLRTIDSRRGIRELFIQEPANWPQLRSPGLKDNNGLVSWEKFFRVVDRGLKLVQRRNLSPLRGKALKSAEQWMLQRFENSDGLGAIFPPMVWSIIALRCRGYTDDSPEMKYCYQRLEGLIIEEPDSASVRIQPCKSPVWDTAITLRALSDSGLTLDHLAVRKAVDWVLDQEIRTEGDWSKTVNAKPGGWCFEFENAYYPDIDDTIMVLMALHSLFEQSEVETGLLPPTLQLVADLKAESPSDAKKRIAQVDAVLGASSRALDWVIAMQNSDGGWAAFDRNNNREFLCQIPFADHNAMLDPSTPDITARVLEALAPFGRKAGDPIVDRAIAYLRKTQEPDGSWFGRWGVNYIYGTWQVVAGMMAAGISSDDPAVAAGVNWLLAHQQPNGGWGESPDTYADPTLRGQGTTTASQTAWALMGLMAAGLHGHSAVAQGVRYLLKHQQADGTWDEPEFTGTGFPQVFYLRYHMYPIYFPLIALSRWASAMGTSVEESAMSAARLIEAATQLLEEGFDAEAAEPGVVHFTARSS